MSRYGIEKACFDLADESNAHCFRHSPDDYLKRYPLSAEESEKIKCGDVGALYMLDVCGGALGELMRFFRYDTAEYVTRLRAAANLPENEGQLKILRERASSRKKSA
jgi:hypothetical protein